MFKNFFIAMFFLFGLLLPSKIEAIGYPALDTTSHWLIGNYGYTSSNGFYFRDVRKNTWTSPGVSEQKTVFYELSIVGVRKGSTEYFLPNPLIILPLAGNPSELYITQFKNIIPNVSLNAYFLFSDNGKFDFDAMFYGSGYNAADNWTIITRTDYDIGGSANNTVEFLWNQNSEGQSINPPQYPASEAMDGVLTYSLPGSGVSDYWSTSGHEISINYPKMKKTVGPGVENQGFARIINTADPEFGMVLWTDSITDIKATFKEYTGSISLNPSANITSILQATGQTGNYPRYAYAGKDQIMFLSLSTTTQMGLNHFGLKLFQRPLATRPLIVRVYQHPPADMRTWRFNPDRIIYTFYNKTRTFRQAIQELVGNDNVIIERSGDNGIPYLPYTGYAGAGQSISESGLNNLMTNIRTSNMENLREWRVDLFIVNWTLTGEPSTVKTMFDYGSLNSNHISREGSAIFFKTITNINPQYLDDKITLYGLQNLGSMLNMHPGWGNCPFTGYCWNDASSGCSSGIKCGSSCPAGVSGCHYSAYSCEKECKAGTVMTNSDFNRNLYEFNFSPASGSQFSEADWYRWAPESWVKPGRFGTSNMSNATLPQF